MPARVSKWEGKWRIRVRVLDDAQLVETGEGFSVLEMGVLVQSAVKEKRGEECASE